LTCQYCETGECPCGTGCESCAYTRVCAECHGLCVADTADLSVRHTERMAARGFIWCPTCRRRTRQLAEAPNYEDLRATNPKKYTKMVTLERCTGCHVPFQDVRHRPFGYTLRKAAA